MGQIYNGIFKFHFMLKLASSKLCSSFFVLKAFMPFSSNFTVSLFRNTKTQCFATACGALFTVQIVKS
jgi:hypothetical protein